MRADGLEPVSSSKQPRNPISRRQVEAVLSRSSAAFGIVFGLQTVPTLLAQVDETSCAWMLVVVPAIFGSLLVAMLFSILKRWVRGAHGLVSIVYLLALVTWPFAVVHPIAPTDNQWLYFLLTVATVTAAISFGIRLALVYLVVAPAIYAVVRVTPAGGGAPWERAVLDAVYAIILGGAALLIITMLRRAAAAVDVAQATALERYAHAVRQNATEAERVQVDAIVHDSVLTTLLSAARAYTPEAKALAASMAERAIGQLREAADASTDDASVMNMERMVDRIEASAAELPARFEVRREGTLSSVMPTAAAESIHSAAVQAMVNSAQHAGEGAHRWLSIGADDDGGVLIEVGDDGRGFDAAAVPPERLGVRVSILERVAGAGGRARIDSAPGRGTVVSIQWPAPRSLAADREEELSAEAHE